MFVTRRAALLALFVVFSSSAALAQGSRLPAETATPLSDELRAIAENVPDEGTARPDLHYVTSNEWRHDLWFDHIRDLGGAFIGVGSDQCYTLAAVQNAQIAWMIDYDPVVPLVHRMYEVLVAASPTPAELIARFQNENVATTRALLTEALEGDPDREAILGVYRRNQPRYATYLVRVSRRERDGVRGSWLADPVLYARVRALFAGHRIIARNGDVTSDRALRSAAGAARTLGVPVRVVYLSNAEQFFRYSDSFIENVRAIPVDERTVLLRTFRDRRAIYPHGDRWHYVVHRWADFLDRIDHGYRRSMQIVIDLVSSRRPRQGANGVSVIDGALPRIAGPRGDVEVAMARE